ncbi:MAG: UDP-glucose--hexose-1-phosphate uridylyltransferase [Luminiphilus sp.]|jgi:UDPglucose--hexose-1-phosphate uridylyltransferase|nr:UDP-glucose--hexose-1-phosphate uridylyltransferase [Luminiphilus sp.]
MTDTFFHSPHRRRNALTGEWVTVSPQRGHRPWQGEVGREDSHPQLSHDPACYLCPGNTRANGTVNPEYQSAWAFDNDFPAVLEPDAQGLVIQPTTASVASSSLFTSQTLSGECRVLCYSPEHHQTLATLTDRAILNVIQLWKQEVSVLRQRHEWVQVFENRGEMMGCSNLHPHGQIWAVDVLPNEAFKEETHQRAWFDREGVPLLEVYRAEEEQLGDRIVFANAYWTVLVPYWAVWPFETLLLPRRRVAHLDDLQSGEQTALASTLKALVGAYDALFSTRCPYTMGWHGAPGAVPAPHWQLHAHFYPPLLRSATVRKHMVGYEMLSEVQRDLTPERAAERLRQVVSVAV